VHVVHHLCGLAIVAAEALHQLRVVK
jgi:hypothetical protein